MFFVPPSQLQTSATLRPHICKGSAEEVIIALERNVHTNGSRALIIQLCPVSVAGSHGNTHSETRMR